MHGNPNPYRVCYFRMHHPRTHVSIGIAILAAFTAGATALSAADQLSSDLTPSSNVNTTAEPVAPGPYQPSWASLRTYGQAPDWFRDAKFGLWAHWGPQCEPESGDWYARHMYAQDHWQYKRHVERYGHPSEFGFKDVINAWKADKWDPARLVSLYKRVGARYFFAMANHHDNLDMWASKHHEWNSVRVGPKKDLIAGWAAAARAEGLPFGVSVHAAHAWSWYETAQSADKTGPKAGVPYDGKLTLADGKGTWWEGLDPQKLYAQNHVPSPGFENTGSIHGRWNWSGGVSLPDAAYKQAFYDRTIDLINQAQPDLLYFDDTALPLWPVSDAGLHIAAHFYNSNLARRGDPGVLFGKILTDDQQKALVWDIERGVPATSLPTPWQTDTCIGGWHYDRGVYDRGHYKSARTVVHMLADIVSKNGNLLLNVPVRGDGSIDDKAEAVLEGIAAWMTTNSEAIYSTRPWKLFGEGPASEGVALSAQGFNEGKGKPFTAADVRYTASKDGKTVYIIVMGVPTEPLRLAALGRTASAAPITGITALGVAESVRWHQEDDHLIVQPLDQKPASDIALVLRVGL